MKVTILTPDVEFPDKPSMKLAEVASEEHKGFEIVEEEAEIADNEKE